jgi:hypothetical protein
LHLAVAHLLDPRGRLSLIERRQVNSAFGLGMTRDSPTDAGADAATVPRKLVLTRCSAPFRPISDRVEKTK